MTCSAIFPGSPSIEPLHLALNAAEDRLQLVLGRSDGQMLHAQEFSAAGRAMPLLAPSLQHAFDRLGIERATLKDVLAGIACVRGPGNFTGLRLSLATALGLSKSVGAPLAGLDYLPLLASGPLTLFPRGVARSVWVVTHARQGEVFVQGFSPTQETGEFPCPLLEAAAVPLPMALQLLSEAPLPALLLGSGTRRHAAVFTPEALPEEMALLPLEWDHPHPSLLLRHALDASYGDAPIAPLYLRVSDAEENLPHIARKQGRDPEAMRQALSRLTGREKE